jgi:hypothetical protein
MKISADPETINDGILPNACRGLAHFEQMILQITYSGREVFRQNHLFKMRP